MVIYRAAMRQEYPPLATDTGVNSYFTIYYNSEIVYTKKKNIWMISSLFTYANRDANFFLELLGGK